MVEKKQRASVFLFTSFQGGTGKSTVAIEFARAYQSISGRSGAFLEGNFFCPSFLVEQFSPHIGLRGTFLDFFSRDWIGARPEHLDEMFSWRDQLMLVPFTGGRPCETLQPRFTFQDAECCPAIDGFRSLLNSRDMFLVIDLLLEMTPLGVHLLHVADVVYYLFSSDPPSPSYAQLFQRELDRRESLMNKVVWLHNLVDPTRNEPEHRLFQREICLPIAGEISGEGERENLRKAINDVAQEAFVSPPQGKAAPALEQQLGETSDEGTDYLRRIRGEIVSGLEKRFGLNDTELRRRVEKHIEQAFHRDPPPNIPDRDVRSEGKRWLLDDILGLGPIEEFMRDVEVDEIMVNGSNRIFVEKRGRLELTGKTFMNNDHVKAVIDRILMPIGRTVNERTPYVDARLLDGSRVHAVIPPLSLTGPMLTIRKFSRIPYTLDDLIYRFKTMTSAVGEFLKLCIQLRKNLIVSGGASSGKTTLLNVLSNHISPRERVICIEDSAELRLNMENLGRLEARQQGTEGKNQVTIRDLVRTSLRMRPDRVIIGECRGAEALDMLQAMNTGHDGSLTTLHANSSRDALSRLETMVLMAGVDLPLRAIREQIASSVNVIVQCNRLADGTRKLVEIAEVVGIDNTTILTESVFKFEQQWIDEEGRVFGEIIPTGIIPRFMAHLPVNLRARTGHLFRIEKRPIEGGAA